MKFLSFSEKVKLEKEDFIVTYRGNNQANQRFFAFIICDAKGLAKMREDYEVDKTSVIAKYGKVIYIDEIAEPDAKAEEFLDEFIKNYDQLKDLLN